MERKEAMMFRHLLLPPLESIVKSSVNMEQDVERCRGMANARIGIPRRSIKC